MAQTLGRYILERTIAVGGMGEVFHARQTGPDGFDRACVVKTMHATLATDPEISEMFLEEARLTARLTHPHVAQVYDFGKIDSAYYIAMELVDGPSLHTVVKAYATRAMKLPLGAVLRIVSQAAQALDYVHRLKGPDHAPLALVHRDISPGNLLLSRDGLVKLIDFGIAKARTTARQTRMGQIRGKLAYMSPEQMLGMPLDGRTDIYSLGLVLYELLSGRRANPGRNEVEILSSVKTGTLAPIQTLRDGCSENLAKVLERAVARDREQRFQRAGDFSQALEQAIVEIGTAVGPADLSDIAELVLMMPPRPSPSSPRPPPRAVGVSTRTGERPAVPTVMAEAAAPVVTRGPPTSVNIALETGTAKVLRPRLVLMGLAALGFVVLGMGTGLWWASQRPPPPAVVQAPPPQPAPPVPAPAPEAPPPVAELKPPQPVDSAPASAPAQVAVVHRPSARTRWAKGEKFEKPAAEKNEPLEAPPAKAPNAASTGAVRVTSDPPTEISVDGRAAGVTPTTLQLLPGSHRVELREPRLKLTWSRTVDVDPQSPQTVEWKAGHGRIDVRPVPPHVELQISVDGVAVGPTPISEFSVWEGSRRVTALNSATGWQIEKSVEVPPGGRVRIKVNDGSGMEIVAK